MKSRGALLAFLLASACSLIRPAPSPRPEAARAGHAAPGGEALSAHLEQRLPGVREIGLVRIVSWAERTPGACTADFASGEGAPTIDADYETDAEKRSIRHGTLDSLVASGWALAYRTPAGIGIDRLARFRSIDLTLRERLECRCFGGERKLASYPATLRFRWVSGRLPEVSAAVERDGKLQGLSAALTVGHLVTYAFMADEPFPEGRPGACSAHLELSTLVDPPLR